jgi:hypothetical protein
MERSKRTKTQKKVLEGLEKAYEKLLEFKKRINSDLVVLKDGKITHIKP